MGRQLRVLIAARHPPGGKLAIGGVQSWCATVGAELCLLGHEVVFWGPGERLAGFFDFGIFANVADTRPAMRVCKKTVTVCHGIILPEKPPASNAAFTSEEVRDYWQGYGPIIRQPIDLDFWKPGVGKKNFLVRFSYRDGLDFVPDIAKSMRLEYAHIKNKSPDDVRAVLKRAAVVLASGRGAVEAMACGAPVVICDDRNYQGPLLDSDTLGSMHRNYSGRGGLVPTAELVRCAIDKAIDRGSLRTHAKENHDVRKIVDQLLETAG